MAFSPDGKAVVTGELRRDGAALGRRHRQAHRAAPGASRAGRQAVAFSPDGKAVADRRARIRRRGSGTPPPASPSATAGAPGPGRGRGVQPRWQGHRSRGSATARSALGRRHRQAHRLADDAIRAPVFAVAFSPDGKTIATGSQDETARLWDAATGKPIGPPLTHQGRSLPWPSAPTARPYVASGELDGVATARLWDAATGKPIGPPLATPGSVSGPWRSAPMARPSLTGSRDRTVRLWDAATGKPLGTPMPQGPVHAVAFSPDGKAIATGSRTGRRGSGTPPPASPSAHRCRTRTVIRPWPSAPMARRSPTGSEDKTARLWDAATGKPIGSPCCTRALSLPWPSAPMARPSPPGAGIIRRGSGTPPPACPSGHRCPPGGVTTVAFSPDGKAIATWELG